MFQDAGLQALIDKSKSIFDGLAKGSGSEFKESQRSLVAAAFTLEASYQASGSAISSDPDRIFFGTSILPQIAVVDKKKALGGAVAQEKSMANIFEYPIHLALPLILSNIFSSDVGSPDPAHFMKSLVRVVLARPCHPAWVLYLVDFQHEECLGVVGLPELLLPFVFLNLETVRRLNQAINPHLSEGQSSLQWLEARMQSHHRDQKISSRLNLALACYQVGLTMRASSSHLMELLPFYLKSDEVIAAINQLIVSQFKAQEAKDEEHALSTDVLSRLSAIISELVLNGKISIEALRVDQMPILSRGIGLYFLDRVRNPARLKQFILDFLRAIFKSLFGVSLTPFLLQEKVAMVCYIFKTVSTVLSKKGEESAPLHDSEWQELLRWGELRSPASCGLLLKICPLLHSEWAACKVSDVQSLYLQVARPMDCRAVSALEAETYLHLFYLALSQNSELSQQALERGSADSKVYALFYRMPAFYVKLQDYSIALILFESYFVRLSSFGQELDPDPVISEAAQDLVNTLFSQDLPRLEENLSLLAQSRQRTDSQENQDLMGEIGLQRSKPSATEGKLIRYSELLKKKIRKSPTALSQGVAERLELCIFNLSDSLLAWETRESKLSPGQQHRVATVMLPALEMRRLPSHQRRGDRDSRGSASDDHDKTQ